jgi:hypothetical protein
MTALDRYFESATATLAEVAATQGEDLRPGEAELL